MVNVDSAMGSLGFVQTKTMQQPGNKECPYPATLSGQGKFSAGKCIICRYEVLVSMCRISS